MSAFIVSDNTMQRAAVGVLLAQGIATPSAEQVTEIGTQLAVLNQAACVALYGNRHGHAGELPPFTGKAGAMPRTLAGMVCTYKQMRCLSYQCNEGSIPDTILYKRLDAAIEKFGDMIARTYNVDAAKIAALPEWNAAPWGIA